MLKKKNKVESKIEEKPFSVQETVFDFIEKRASFSVDFVRDAVIEKAARERLLIDKDSLSVSWNLVPPLHYHWQEEFKGKAHFTWKEKVICRKDFCK
jgi:hypothetical protein